MDVLVTGAVNEVGRAVAAEFRNAGHRVVITGPNADELEIAAKELEVDAIVCDNADPDSLEDNVELFPQHLDAIVNIPNPVWSEPGPHLGTLTDTGEAWLSRYESNVLTAVLTVQAIGDHLRSGAAIINLCTLGTRDRSGATTAAKAALSAWTAEQAERMGTRGITINTIAPGQSAEANYDGLDSTEDAHELVAGEIARLALFLTSPQARHITGQTLHVSRGVPAGVS
ncbi:SDR family oxidoreductase [Mycobacteroides abscessus]|uniref:SDR family oxidoreductase n=1 Tax=Mycobacteroides abscessus TaxID=36809 RepID=UPI00188FCD31|nr:SDR family oxidoreductase [Mycobacteroides abscessus]